VIHGAQNAGIRLGDRVALLGAGPIGLLMLQVLRSLGAGEVSVLERNAFRVRKARELGARVLAASMEELGRDHYDLVVDATGSLAVMGRALELARYGGTVLWFGVAPRGQTLPIEPFLVFRKGLTLLSSYTSLRNSLQAIELLSSGQVAGTPIISHRLPLEQLSRGLRLLEQGEAEVGKVLILPGDG
jgi:D-arabinitol dehydrogenase (NADP+)